ncbi:MAG: hypothetical protein HYT16_00520 [DPANN group archaeon]|nr:hypothetical protein [DPANN group archaeon]
MVLSNCASLIGLEQRVAEETQAPTLLDKLGRFLTSGKEKLQVAGQTIKQNANLILFAGMYINIVAGAAMFSFDAVYHPERFPNLTKMVFTIERAYAATAAVGAALAPVWAAIYYNKFKTGNVFGIQHGRL